MLFPEKFFHSFTKLPMNPRPHPNAASLHVYKAAVTEVSKQTVQYLSVKHTQLFHSDISC